MSAGRGSRVRGFTLIEVLVALFVFAVAMTALIQAGTNRAQNLGYLRDRTLASWIASNRITALRLDPETDGTGTRDGEVEMAGRTWQWEADISSTPDETVRRIEVAVRLGDPDAEPLARMTGFIAAADVRDETGRRP